MTDVITIDDDDDDTEPIQIESKSLKRKADGPISNGAKKPCIPTLFEEHLNRTCINNMSKVHIERKHLELPHLDAIVQGFEPFKELLRRVQGGRNDVQGDVGSCLIKLKSISALSETNRLFYHMAVFSEANDRVLYKASVPHFTEPDDPPPVSIKKHTTGSEELKIVDTVKVTKTKSMPPIGPIVHGEVTLGTTVYAMKTNLLDIWEKAVVVGVTETPTKLFSVKFESRIPEGSVTRTLRELAHYQPLNVQVPVRRRIIAMFQSEGDTKCDMYSGIVAEPPKSLNKYRYLVFFDDGFAQYKDHHNIRLVYEESKNIWDDVCVDIKPFIQQYCEAYPERPMLKLQQSQYVHTELNGKRLKARVLEVDSSLVLMEFDKTGDREWIYRGSTRLTFLFDELEKAKQSRMSGKNRRHNISTKKPDANQPYVEYTTGFDEVVDLAEKPQSDFEVQKTIMQPNACYQNNDPSQSPFGEPEVNAAAVASDKPMRQQKARKSTTQIKTAYPNGIVMRPNKVSHLQTYTVILDDSKRPRYDSHTCSALCRKEDDLDSHQRKNPLLIPMCAGWYREIKDFKNIRKQCNYAIMVQYKSPCGRMIRNIEDLNSYLSIIKSEISIDHFTFDSNVLPRRTFKILKEDIQYYDKDITKGCENKQISCINTLTKEKPLYVEYSASRFAGKGVTLNLDPNFLCGCDCTDNCQDWTRCQCQQLTYKAYCYNDEKPDFPGYRYRRLKYTVITGIYECNSTCSCNKFCMNRVVQHGITIRLQMFKTQKKGWGIRCLDDVPAGMHICSYAGQLLTDQGADEDGNQYGDEYLAELDHIEVSEKTKDGYEPAVVEMSSDSSESFNSNDSDSEYDGTSLDVPFKYSKSSFWTSKKEAMKNGNLSSDVNNASTNFRSFLETYSLSPNTLNVLKDTSMRKPKFVDEKSPYSKKTGKKTGSDWPQVIQEEKQQRPKYVSVRTLFGEEDCYIMDAKTKGNIGRYLNHSCMPNCFVQNVFTDTHDLRFPNVSFFSLSRISAGSELTWDYNYQVGSVPGRNLPCYCEAPNCKRRLL